MVVVAAVLASHKYIFFLESGLLEVSPPPILGPFCMCDRFPFFFSATLWYNWWWW